MAPVRAKTGPFSITAYRGDAKTLLAFNLTTKPSRTNLAGFTVEVKPPGVPSYYLLNALSFKDPSKHAQVTTEPATSTVNAPLHRFRWVHHPGLFHQGLAPKLGEYTYTVTPRYFDKKQSLLPLDPGLGASVKINVAPFQTGKLSMGFTRGFVQSQAYVRHFGNRAPIRPADAALTYDLSRIAGTNPKGESFTYETQYQWLGFTARKAIRDLLDEAVNDPGLRLDVFAYDLNEPSVVEALLTLGKAKRVRIILDNAALHHSKTDATLEDDFETEFTAVAGAGALKRGHFGRYAHNKVFVVSDATGPVKVLTGSTNFSVTGLYVNSNHILIYDDRTVAKLYSDVFGAAWDADVKAAAFKKTAYAKQTFTFATENLPKTSITFSPHDEELAGTLLDRLVKRVGKEKGKSGSVLFAVMTLDGDSENPVYDALNVIHKRQDVFSYGISDAPKGISLYKVGKKTGLLVTGKPVDTVLPEPFSQVPGVRGHQVHHKFIVCGFNGSDPTVYCGSSNLALMGEQVNGDNLLEIHDEEIATVFAIEALELVDHFEFLGKLEKKSKASPASPKPADKADAAKAAKWFLGTTDAWAEKYFDPDDLHSVDRVLFAD